MTRKPEPVDPLAAALNSPAGEPVERIGTDRPAMPDVPLTDGVEAAGEELPEAMNLDDILTEADIAKARQRARDRFVAEERKARLKAIEDEELEKLKLAQGLVTGDRRNDELVYIHLNLAEHSDRLVLNGATYWHGQTYKVTRAQADTMRDIVARGWKHQDEIEGKDLTAHYRRALDSGLSGVRGISNAPATAPLAEFRH